MAYPAALSRLPAPYVWSVIFFLMLITLGFGSQMTIVQTVVTNVTDLWPEKLQNRKTIVLAVVCFVMFLSGLPMCTGVKRGVYCHCFTIFIFCFFPSCRLACTSSS